MQSEFYLVQDTRALLFIGQEYHEKNCLGWTQNMRLNQTQNLIELAVFCSVPLSVVLTGSLTDLHVFVCEWQVFRGLKLLHLLGNLNSQPSCSYGLAVGSPSSCLIELNGSTPSHLLSCLQKGFLNQQERCQKAWQWAPDSWGTLLLLGKEQRAPFY